MSTPRITVQDDHGRTRPMRPREPVCSSAAKRWEGFLVEEHAPARWESRNVFLLASAIYLALGDGAELEWNGAGRLVSRRLRAGQISILPANHSYSARVRAAGGSVVVSLEPKLLAGAGAEQGLFGEVEPVWVHGVDDSLIRELILALRGETRAAGRGNPAYARSLAAALAAHVIRRYATDRLRIPGRPGGLSAPALRAVINLVQDHLGEEMPVERLAREVNLSAAHFARLFKHSTGLTPHDYVLRSRLSRAKQLLAGGATSLVETASLAGFCDQAHMTRGFRRLLGTTPGEYARRFQSAGRLDVTN